MQLRAILKKLKKINPLQLCFTSKFIIIMQAVVILFYIVARLLAPYHKRTNIQLDFRGIFIIALSFLTIILIVQIFNSLFAKKPRLRICSNIILISLYIIFFTYHLTTHSSLDYSVIYDNIGLLFYEESIPVVFSASRLPGLFALGFLIFILILLEKKKKILSTWKTRIKPLFQFVFAFVLYVLILISQIYVHDDLTFFLQSAYHYHFPDYPVPKLKENEYPYLKIPDSKNPQTSANLEDNPHIFLIWVESFNTNYVNTKNEQGIEYTPFFNSLIKKGIYIEKFYGNSIQTAKGQLATIASILPSFRGKVFTHFPELNLRTLPEILLEFNYETLFFKAYPRLSFDNTGEFVLRNGFNIAKGMNEEFTQDVDEKYIWGWGLQDNIFYQKFFEYVDELETENIKNQKYFATLTTVSNHNRFNRLPEDQMYLHREPKNTREDYANSIYLTDLYLKEFFVQLEKRKYLKNSIVIILGDHSFPLGEHGNYHNEVGAYEESFRTPFVMLWNKLEPQYIKDFAYSQLDIAPTILDLLNIQTKNHFLGKSIFEKRQEQEIIHLVQPYDGTYLVALKYPYKYIKHLRTNREFLYNLDDDPLEKKNIIRKFPDKDLINKLRKSLHQFYLNQKLIQKNRIYPQK